MGVECDLYNPASDTTFELGKGRPWAVPAENTEEAWRPIIITALSITSDDLLKPFWVSSLARALVAFCEPDISACILCADCARSVAETLDRWPPPRITHSRYASPPTFEGEG